MKQSQIHRRPLDARGGFTLIEILVVIGIIIILVAIALPALNAARRVAKRTAISQTLAMLETGLVAYTQDWKGQPPPVTGQTVHQGYAVLGAILVGPGGAVSPSPGVAGVPTAPLLANKEYLTGDVVSDGTAEFVAIRKVPAGTATGSAEYWKSFGADQVYSDGKNGFGVTAAGKSWGPYIQPDKLKMRGSTILDVEENPIGYVPARAVKNNVRVPLPLASGVVGSYVDANPQSQYNATPNLFLFVRTDRTPENETTQNATHQANALKRMQLHMRALPVGVANAGCLDPKKDAIDVPFILWSAGLDDEYGPDLDDDPTVQQRLVDKCDDITNFK